jgi:predicted amidohydrolase YtcJ
MNDLPGLLLRNVEIYPEGRGDCRVRDGLITQTGARLDVRPGEAVVRGEGAALLPGFADHHLHLAAMAAHARSMDASSLSRAVLAREIARAAAGDDGWIRVVGYDEVRHGELDRDVLDGWNRMVPVRVQHRSGALWVVNSRGLSHLEIHASSHSGVERDRNGDPTGRLWRADTELRSRLGAPPPSLRQVSERLASLGVTHVADATPDAGSAALVAAAMREGDLLQYVMVMAGGHLNQPRLVRGPVKLVVADHCLPGLNELSDWIRHAHACGRAVAVHCVTRASLALTIAAIDEAGGRDGDRIEHCAVADRLAAEQLAARGLLVVTQPTLLARRGDDYWERVDPEDRACLWPYAGLLRAGVKVAASSDAPYGDPDPWSCLQAAITRRTPSGRVLGPHERVPAQTVLRSLLASLDDPGGPARRVAAGQPADLVLLDRPLAAALATLQPGCVRVTIIAGRVVYGAENLT